MKRCNLPLHCLLCVGTLISFNNGNVGILILKLKEQLNLSDVRCMSRFVSLGVGPCKEALTALFLVFLAVSLIHYKHIFQRF